MHTDPQSAPSVRLFPRLAVTKRSRVSPPHRIAIRRIAAAAKLADGPKGRSENVRERLLRMILDNEEARRNDRRPSAS